MSFLDYFVRRTAILIVAPTLTVAMGCSSMRGHWTGRDVQPEMAREQLQFFRSSHQTGNFVAADLRLQRDKSYIVEVNYGGTVTTHNGTWAYKRNQLKFTGSDGQVRSVECRKPNSRTLEVLEDIKGTHVALKMQKQRN